MVLIITQSRKYKAIVPIIQWFQEFGRWEEEELVDPRDIRVDDETILYCNGECKTLVYDKIYRASCALGKGLLKKNK